jgi:hypothetical protein
MLEQGEKTELAYQTEFEFGYEQQLEDPKMQAKILKRQENESQVLKYQQFR